MRIVRKDFVAWLKKNKHASFIPNDPCRCPLARHLTDKGGSQAHVLSPSAYADDWEMTLPRWATDFVESFDAMTTRCGRVTGARALELL